VDFPPAHWEQTGWKPYLMIIHHCFPNAQIVLDKFKLIGQFNKAIDPIRKDEQNLKEG